MKPHEDFALVNCKPKFIYCINIVINPLKNTETQVNQRTKLVSGPKGKENDNMVSQQETFLSKFVIIKLK